MQPQWVQINSNWMEHVNLSGSSKAILRCYTSICDGIIFWVTWWNFETAMNYGDADYLAFSKNLPYPALLLNSWIEPSGAGNSMIRLFYCGGSLCRSLRPPWILAKHQSGCKLCLPVLKTDKHFLLNIPFSFSHWNVWIKTYYASRRKIFSCAKNCQTFPLLTFVFKSTNKIQSFFLKRNISGAKNCQTFP